VAVRDEGPGIAAEDQERVFDRFFSTDDQANTAAATTHNGNGGHGIGLAIARQIVEAHDGRLVVFSADRAGSTFVAWLPDRTFTGKGGRGAAPPEDDPLGAPQRW
jgi:signal transduction histidine kinase